MSRPLSKILMASSLLLGSSRCSPAVPDEGPPWKFSTSAVAGTSPVTDNSVGGDARPQPSVTMASGGAPGGSTSIVITSVVALAGVAGDLTFGNEVGNSGSSAQESGGSSFGDELGGASGKTGESRDSTLAGRGTAGEGAAGIGNFPEFGTGGSAGRFGFAGATGAVSAVECDSSDQDFDQDGVCDRLDEDDDDDGYLDKDDFTIGGVDLSLDPTQPPGGKGAAPNSVLNEPCMKRVLELVNSTLDQRNEGTKKIQIRRLRQVPDRTGYYLRVAEFGHILMDSGTASGTLTGHEGQLRRNPDGTYAVAGRDFWNGSGYPAWSGSIGVVFRGSNNRFTAYSRTSVNVAISSGTLNPATGSSFDETGVVVDLKPDTSGNCGYRVSYVPRGRRVTRDDFNYYCKDEMRTFAFLPSAQPLDPLCNDATEVPWPSPALPCQVGQDYDGDTLDNCSDPDDDDDGVPDLDDCILGTRDLSLDGGRPGGEQSSAPEAILNEACVAAALVASGWSEPLSREMLTVEAGGFFRRPSNSTRVVRSAGWSNVSTYLPGYEAEFIHHLRDEYDIIGWQSDESGQGSAMIIRGVVMRGTPDRFTLYERLPDYVVISTGHAIATAGMLYAGQTLTVRVPRDVNNSICPGGYGGWMLADDSLERVSSDAIEHMCIERDIAYLPTKTWRRSNGETCTCTAELTNQCI